MFDADIEESGLQRVASANIPYAAPTLAVSRRFLIAKRCVDILAALFLLVPTMVTAAVLYALNPFYNRGSLLYRQTRMGKDCVPFTAFKFRSMTEVSSVTRGAFDDLEVDRITVLGRFLRKSRLDELPQIINILKGDMTLIGPRPDFIDHAKVYVDEIPGYKERYAVRPGVTGLAQTDVGYVSDENGFQRKVAADLRYIRTMGFVNDLRLILKTIRVMCLRHGH